VLPPGVDLDHFRPRDSAEVRAQVGLPPDGIVVLAVRRLAERMGLDVLLEAWTLRPGGLLLLAGQGPARPRSRHAAPGLGLGPDRVRFLGRVPDDDLALLYAAADVSVVPTTEFEGFGLMVLESLAAGTPVIASAVGGLTTEVLPLLQTDLLVPQGDPAALAARLQGGFDGSPPLPGQACREIAEQFGWSQVADRFRALYVDAARNAPGPRIRAVYLVSTGQPSGGELALLRTLTAVRDQVHPHVVLAESGPFCALLTEAGVSWEVLAVGDAVSVRRAEVGSPPAAVRQGLRMVAPRGAPGPATARAAARCRARQVPQARCLRRGGGTVGVAAVRLARATA
jgi:hypothetical protein